MMASSDIYLLLIIEMSVLLFALYALFSDKRREIMEAKDGPSGTATRSDKTMTMLHTVYGSSLASFLVIVTNADGAKGHQVALILVPFICLTYLFYFSTWFRNVVFLPISGKIRKD